MKAAENLWRWFGLVAGLALVCSLVSYLTSIWIMSQSSWKHDAENGHHWLHQELGLNAEEAAAVDAFDPEYRRDRAELLAEFNKQIQGLQEVLMQNSDYTDEVAHAIHQLHGVHGQLQELAIRHYYDMRAVLPEDKQKKLDAIALEALSTPE